MPSRSIRQSSIHVPVAVDTEWPERQRRNIFYTAGLLKSLGWPQEQDDARAQQGAFRDLLRLAARSVHLHAFQLEGDALVGPSPAVELARGMASSPAAPEPPRATFTDELLMIERPPAGGLGEDAAAWLDLRGRRPLLSDPRYAGFVGPRPARSREPRESFVDCPFKFFAEDCLGCRSVSGRGCRPQRGTLVHVVRRVLPGVAANRPRHDRGRIAAGGAGSVRSPDRDALSNSQADRALEKRGCWVHRSRTGRRVFELEADSGGGSSIGSLNSLEGPFTFPRLHGLAQRVVEIRGKADRIDVFANGELRVVDYKLSKLPDRDTSIQIAVYAWAVQQALEARDGRSHVVTNAMYLAFGDERQSEGRLDTPGAATVGTIMARASDFAAAIDRIEAGEYPPAPLRPADCQWCRYAGVCRKEYAAESV